MWGRTTQNWRDCIAVDVLVDDHLLLCIRAITTLPATIGLLSLRELAWPMAQIASEGPDGPHFGGIGHHMISI